MKSVFVDTSAFYAFLDRTDPFHPVCRALLLQAEAEQWRLVTSSFVIHETWSLIQARLGWEAVEDWLAVFVPRGEVIWVTPTIYERGAARCPQARKRKLGLTDGVSFEVMNEVGCRLSLADDEDFRLQGFPLPRD